ncbi:flagellin lysine-N-methylase [Niveibacterium sp. 24ML]|uniref:flagellin lysine-N-methylase n=1 Tax=Niveibacterium sp. 24ML TaxID=2985512 RepID=UPI0022717C53|nr:flagellin lysine-N-methylase [Niveibacterium sp. 24ML]MCX9154969.1 flagellin lysine-N-methylase [Niveibacterium sp. 24ML]
MGKHSPIAEAPRYMQQFQCTGSACPENCCTGWKVSIDKSSYQLYRDVRREPLAGLFREGLERLPGGGTYAYAQIRLREDGSCPFLDERRLCRIHGELGEQALSTTCSQYPRVFGLDGQDHQLHATLSCPEAARLALTDPGGLDPVSLQLPFPNPQRVPLSIVRAAPNETEPDPVSKHARLIGQVIQALVRMPALSAAQSLVQAGLMLRHIARIETRGPSGEQALAQVIEHYMAPQTLAQVPALLAGLEVSRETQLSMLFETTRRYLAAHSGRPSFQALIQDVQDGLQVEQDPDGVLARLEAALRERWMPLESAQPQLLKNYLLNDLAKSLFPRNGIAGLEREFMDLAMRFALIKFFLLGLAAKRGAAFGADDVVRVVYVVVRNIEHNASFMASVMSDLEARDALRLEVLATLVL